MKRITTASGDLARLFTTIDFTTVARVHRVAKAAGQSIRWVVNEVLVGATTLRALELQHGLREE